jgi:hypothetical protein
LEEDGYFGVMQPFLAYILKPVNDNEGEGKEETFFFIFLEKSVSHHIFFTIFVNGIIIIAKKLGHPFFFLCRWNELF